MAGVQGAAPSLQLEVRAGGEDLLHSAFADQQVAARRGRNHDRHAAPAEIERHLVDDAPARVDAVQLAHLHVLQHGFVEQIAQAGLEMTVEPCKLQHAFGLIAVHVQMALEDDAVLGEGAGLVGAQHVHGAQVLDRVQALDDHLDARHRQGTLGQIDGHDHRQHLGRQPDGHGQRKQQRFQPVLLVETVDQEHQRHHHADQAQHQANKAVHAMLEGSAFLLRDHLVRQRTEEGAATGPHDHPGAETAHDIGPHEADVGHVERVVHWLAPGLGELLRRHGLAGQGGLVDEQVLGFDQPQIRRHDIACRQANHIPGHQALQGQVGEAAIVQITPSHACAGLDHRAQTRSGRVRAMLLHERSGDGQHHHRQHHGAGARIAEQKGCYGEAHQQGIQRVCRPAPEFAPDGRPLIACHGVRAVFARSGRGFGHAQASG
mmetsp:Transcript_37512/g.87390  ORF Transcript_37512/g.87390 Transcript_37512/m.87390 type:complete len:432 (-) Transcript_37512:1781-3076(-)